MHVDTHPIGATSPALHPQRPTNQTRLGRIRPQLSILAGYSILPLLFCGQTDPPLIDSVIFEERTSQCET